MPYVDVGFGPAYYEVRGNGPPVVLLHGGAFGFAAGLMAPQIADLAAAGFTVYSLDRVGHGRTPDRDRPYSYQAMADETAAFIESVVATTPVHLIGWSDGMTVGVQVLLRHPDLLDRFVGIGASFNATGDTPGVAELSVELRTDPWPTLVESYGELSPDGPDHLTDFLAKLTDLWDHRIPQIDLDELTAVETPVLLIQGDQDLVRVEHTAAAARALPNGRLAVLPGNHLFPLHVPQLLDPILIAFLRDELPPLDPDDG